MIRWSAVYIVHPPSIHQRLICICSVDIKEKVFYPSNIQGKNSFPGFERKLTSKLSWGKFHILGGLVTKDSTRPGVIGISYPAWSSRRVSLEFPTRPGHHAGCHWNFPPGLVKVIPITIKKSFLLN